MSFCVGLTGGIGSGKTTVANLFAELGAGVVDTDLISHQLTGPNGRAMPDIAAFFGATYVDERGALHRAAMRERVFSDPRAKQDLERILHPKIMAQAQAELARSPATYTLLVAPLLFENPLFQQPVQRILVVDCPEAVQVMRVVQRSQLGIDMVRTIIAQQIPRAERLSRAHDILCNENDLTSLRMQVAALHATYEKFSSKNIALTN